MEADGIVGEHRVVAEGRRDVVLPGDFGGGEHRDHAGAGADGGEVEGGEAAARAGGLADGDMERALRLAQVVDVERRALHVLRGGIVGQRAVHVAEGLWLPLPEGEGWGEGDRLSA